MKMKIGFIGLGKLGLPCALAIESKGHTVIGYDINDRVIEIIKNRKIPYLEAGAQEALEKSNIKIGTLSEVVKHSEIIFIAIQTPHHEKFEGITRLTDERVDFDYTFLKKGVGDLANEIKKHGKDKIVVIISTVLPGTIKREIKPLLNNHVKLCYNPFFIAMGTCIRDFLHPEFILLGVDDEDAAKKLEHFYNTINNAQLYKTKIENAELIKVAYNTYIGMKIAFVNTLMEICHKTKTNVDEVTNALKLSNLRLISGKYLSGGMGDGGGCHPRDNIALSWLARELNLSYDWFENVMLAREKQTEWLTDLIIQQKNLNQDYPIIVLGKAFKPETNIITGSPAILLKNILEEKGYQVEMYDPYVDNNKIDISKLTPSIFFIGTKHKIFNKLKYPSGSIIIDPWRYIEDQQDVKIIRIGE
ncbi:MAG: nucleotide sugar dehydrogenase [Candidatus Helarchaeota archaeon]